MRLLRTSGLAAAIVLTMAMLPAQPAEKPTDAQIAHIAYTAGNLDIKAAELALDKSKNESVRAFANDMVRDHKAVNDKALALVKKLNVTPEDKKNADKLANDFKQALERAKSKPTPPPAGTVPKEITDAKARQQK